MGQTIAVANKTEVIYIKEKIPDLHQMVEGAFTQSMSKDNTAFVDI